MGSAIAARTITNLLGLILRHGLSIKLPEFFGTGRLQFTSSRLWPSLSGNFRIARQGSPPDGKDTAAHRADRPPSRPVAERARERKPAETEPR
jgi:hypothetical protein